MRVERLVEIIGADFYTGVPDSQLKALCDYLFDKYGIDQRHHIIAANEGNAVALGAGYHLATDKIPVVYMQNSGEGNIVNPVASLLNKKVYNIPMIFIIGWRGEPGVHDEPQHIYQGEITLNLLDDLGISYFVIDCDTSESDVKNVMVQYKEKLSNGDDVAFVIRKGGLTKDGKTVYLNQYEMSREEVIKHIVEVSGEEPIISTTGKASRELFEIREANGQPHKYDFLTVGSMGHSSSIALGVAISKPDKKVWCIDGDGAVLMHMGAMAVIGANRPKNMVHVVINNTAHETVGGMPTVAGQIDIAKVAVACGYQHVVSVEDYPGLDTALKDARARTELTLIEVKCALGARENLGRPTTTTHDNKIEFMKYLKNYS